MGPENLQLLNHVWSKGGFDIRERGATVFRPGNRKNAKLSVDPNYLRATDDLHELPCIRNCSELWLDPDPALSCLNPDKIPNSRLPGISKFRLPFFSIPSACTRSNSKYRLTMDLERRLNERWNLAVSFDRLTPSTHPLQRNTSALVILPSHRLNQGSFHFLNGRRSRRS